MTTQDLAAEALKHFEKRTRDNGDEFYSIRKDDRPQWLQDLCHAAHADMMPDDHKYRFIVEALDTISESDPDMHTYNIDSPEPDIYTHSLLAWLASHLERSGYCDEYMQEISTPQNTIDLIQGGQYLEKREVFDLVLRALQDRLDALEVDRQHKGEAS